MRATFAVICAVVPVLAFAQAQNDPTLVIGQLSFSGTYIHQVVSVKNGSIKSFRSIKIECGFFRQDQLIATGYSFVDNLAPNSAGFTEVLASNNAAADRAQCRIAEVR
jgi:hypothetical protein